MDINKKTNGRVDLMASQPGGTFATLHFPDADDSPSRDDSMASVVYHPLGSVRARNPSINTEVTANIKRKKREGEEEAENYSAICTLDGELTQLSHLPSIQNFCVVRMHYVQSCIPLSRHNHLDRC